MSPAFVATAEAKQAAASHGPAKLPFRLKKGMRGLRVLALERALKAAGLRKLRPLPLYGPGCVKQVKRLQKLHHLPQTGVYDGQTHRFLARYYDSYGAYLLEHGQTPGPQPKPKPVPKPAPRPKPKPSPKPLSHADQVRALMMRGCLILVAHAAAVHYTQGSLRMIGVLRRIHLPGFPRYGDCSSTDTWLFYESDGPDPNGLHFDGRGYTGTMQNHGRRVTLAEAKPGDQVFYGKHGEVAEHVATYLGHGKVFSHGSEGGPYILPIDYRPDRVEIRNYLD